jgi:hypothetical protein
MDWCESTVGFLLLVFMSKFKESKKLLSNVPLYEVLSLFCSVILSVIIGSALIIFAKNSVFRYAETKSKSLACINTVQSFVFFEKLITFVVDI